MEQGGLVQSHSASEGVKGAAEGAGLFPAAFLSAYQLFLAVDGLQGLNIQHKALPHLLWDRDQFLQAGLASGV